jgi:hypothetical protein
MGGPHIRACRIEPLQFGDGLLQLAIARSRYGTFALLVEWRRSGRRCVVADEQAGEKGGCGNALQTRNVRGACGSAVLSRLFYLP